MKKIILTILLSSFLCLSACSPLQPLAGIAKTVINEETPADMAVTVQATNTPEFEQIQEPDFNQTRMPADKVDFIEADQADTYWVTNPASAAQLFVQVIHAPDWSGASQPALVLVPGGISSGGNLLPEAKVFASRGFTVVLFDPDGRGRSQGSEDFDGFIHQDGLAAVIRFTQDLAEVKPGQVGLVSYSYGLTMATGTLARYPQLGVRFLIDWEGPIDRYDTTTTSAGECQVEISKQHWRPCEDEHFWSQREAILFITQVLLPAYQRVQSEKDHVQPDVTHAIRIINKAVAAGIGWVRLNDLPLNNTYDETNPPKMVPEALDKTRDQRIAELALELMELFAE